MFKFFVLHFYLRIYCGYALPTTLTYPPARDIFPSIGLLLDYAVRTPLQSLPRRDPSSNKPT